MRNFGSFALGLIGAAAVASASDVHDLRTDNFKEFVESHDLVLAEFFAPWCGHCKALAPEYEEAATALKEKNIPLAKVDCTVEGDLCKSFGVEGYPTIKVFRGAEEPKPYSGARKAPAIISYMTKQSLPAVSTLTAESLEEFKTADKLVLVAYFDADDKASNETYSAFANERRDDYLFGATNDDALAKAEGVKKPSIVLYKDFDEGKNIFDAKFEKEAIATFAKTAGTPLVGEVGPETYSAYMSAGLPLAYIFAETPEERKELAAALKPIAEEHKGVINFATIDAKAFGAHAQNLNLEVGKWPAFAIQDTQKNQKYPYDQAKTIAHKDIDAFVKDFVAGKVEASIKSEPIPDKQEGPVTVVVARSYNDVVLNDEKDVLIEFYAPWCGHCKSLAPKYEELAALYPASSNVIVAKVDATANDVPDEISGFPTIKLYPAGAKDKAVIYSGPRTVEDLAAFIKEAGKYGYDGLAAKPDDEDVEAAADTLGHAAPAATEKSEEADKAESTPAAAETTEGGIKEAIKSKVADVADAAKTAAGAIIEDEGQDHDEL